MKKLLLAITMVLVFGGLNAFALGSSRSASYQGQSSGPVTGQAAYNILDSRGGVIYNITLNAGATNAVLLVYDSGGPGNPTPGLNNENLLYEVETVTAGSSATVDFGTAPLNTYNGITVSVTNGVGYLNYQP